MHANCERHLARLSGVGQGASGGCPGFGGAMRRSRTARNSAYAPARAGAPTWIDAVALVIPRAAPSVGFRAKLCPTRRGGLP